MKSYLLDTNGLLRYLLDDIPKQADVVEKYFLEAEKSKIRLTIPLLVFFESVFMLSRLYKKPRVEIAHSLLVITHKTFIDIEKRNLIVNALKIYRIKNISFVDSYLYTQASFEGMDLITFDKKLKKLKIPESVIIQFFPIAASKFDKY